MLLGMRVLGPLFASASAVPILLAAVPVGFDRLASMPPKTRQALSDRLERFDQLPEADRRSIRALDDALSRLPPEERRRYLDLMDRYASWYRSLDPEARREIDSTPPDRRISLIRERLAAEDVPGSPRVSPAIWVGSSALNPVPLYDAAALLRVWASLDDRERRRVESARSPDDRLDTLRRLGRDLGLKPADPVRDAFREILLDRVKLGQRRFREQLDELSRPGQRNLRPSPPLDDLVDLLLDPFRPVDPRGAAGPRRPFFATELPEPFRTAVARLATNRLAVRMAEIEYLRDLQQRPSSATGPELAAFEANLPDWYRTTLDPLPPEVARLRIRALRELTAGDPSLEALRSAPPPPSAPTGEARPPRGVAF
ncbi:DUF3106 domain-containing protein [Tautonia sociabilis]|uniref:DUF3106 domain-containing protein n=1 Tax=Tautonia sociabilis TaxID=2080755 RepID=A0A432MRB4_9BACT|nr:DUF3106 domain-containing protein [Tautonia sociabilis]RUL89789.1 DUF3106 domain-containing protein [Tautonia sociabilis]